MWQTSEDWRRERDREAHRTRQNFAGAHPVIFAIASFLVISWVLRKV
jgi:hypothetical protein